MAHSQAAAKTLVGNSLVLPPLPYPISALEPYVSARALGLHHAKHHSAYLQKTNELVAGTDLAGAPLERIVRATAERRDNAGLFNNAAQAWNHSFFFESMKPQGGGLPAGAIGQAIDKNFGSYDNFADKFQRAANAHFGSGWAWLVSRGGKLDIVCTANADLPLVHGQTPLLALDLWEHAYYLDYQNRRAEFVKAYLEHLVNWGFAGRNLGAK